MEQPEQKVVDQYTLFDFCYKALIKHGVPNADAKIVSEVLIAADLRGVESHGVASLSRYIDDIKKGIALTKPESKIIAETPVTLLIDGGGGLGHPIAYRSMLKAIEKALRIGVGMVAVRNTNHFGMAGYYAMQALEHDCIGIAVTNSIPGMVPTFGLKAMLGTNPIAFAAPAGDELPFVLDMATSVVAFGKVNVYKHKKQPIPPGWGIDENASPVTNAEILSRICLENKAGGLLPLGGFGELAGGYKGFGLALLVEILSGVFSGSAYADLLYPKTGEGEALPSGIGQLFAAMRINCFQTNQDFKNSMDDLLQRLRKSSKAPGQERIFIPGEKEYEAKTQRSQSGIPVPGYVIKQLNSLASELGIEPI